MKRIGHLWPGVVSFDNLLAAFEKARRGKRDRPNVALFEFTLEHELCRLRRELLDHAYRPGSYRTFYINDPKRRMISAAPFRDRVVHHALCRVLEPVFERGFIDHSYACRAGKGTHAAVDYFQRCTRRFRCVLTCDVSKFFPSVDHTILKDRIARRIKDPDVLWLAARIIDDSNPQEPVSQWFPGDDLFTPGERRHGLPIGNQTSQFFGNVYLDPLDHFASERLRAPAYLRYADDFVMFADNRAWLGRARAACRAFLESLRLKIHPRKCAVSRTADGTTFLGFRVFPDRRRLRRANVVGFRRRLASMQKRYAAGELSPAEVGQRVAGWLGHAGHADTFRLRAQLLGRVTFVRGVRE